MISIYKLTDYKKKGGLKKNAKPVLFYSSTENDINYTRIANFICDSGFYLFRKPYIFDHINAMHKDYGEVIITQYFLYNGVEIMTTPENLFDALKYRN
jgi:hypothetical protein